jgi:hypothetical protein
VVVVAAAAMTMMMMMMMMVKSDFCALLGYYVASSGNPLATFRDKVSVPSSRVKKKNP